MAGKVRTSFWSAATVLFCVGIALVLAPRTKEDQPFPLPAHFLDEATLALVPEGMLFRRVSPKEYQLPGADFFLLETEVTNRMYAGFLAATKRGKGDEELRARAEREEALEMRERQFSTASPALSLTNKALLWRGNTPPQGAEEFPVVLCTVHEGDALCRWLTKRYPELGTFRFPTAEEWQVAAYGARRNYPWGNEWDPDRLCCSSPAKQCSPEEVMARPQGRTPEGIYGLWGNVSEFVIHSRHVQNALFVGVGGRWMGGSFGDSSFKPRQDYWGYWHSSQGRSDRIGFRVLLDINDKEHGFRHRVPYDLEEGPPRQP